MEIVAIITGALLGFVMAIPPGPVSVSVLKIGLDKGFKPGVLFALGNFAIEIIYALIAVFAASAVLTAISNFSDNYPVVSLIIQLSIVFAIILIGFMQLKMKKKNEQINSIEPSKKSKILDFLMTRGPFFLGVGITLTNIANPTYLPGITFMATGYQKFLFHNQILVPSFLNNIIFAFGIALGNFLWIILIAKLIVTFKSRMSDKLILKIRKFAGFTLIGIGTFLGMKIITAVKWGEIFRLILAF